MKFRVERDVLAEAVAWAARSLPARPPVPVLAGLMLDADTDAAGRLVLSSFDYEVSARVEIAGRRHRARRGPGQRPAARRHHPQPAGPPGRGGHRRRQGGRHLRHRPGSPCSRCRSRTTRPCPRCPVRPARCAATLFAAAVGQVSIAAGRDDTLPVLTGVRLEIEGEKITLAATDRYRLAVRDLAWTPEQAGLSAIALVPGPHPGRHREVAGHGRQGHRRAGVRGHRRGPGRLRGRRPAHDLAAARRRVPQVPARCCPPSPPASRRSRPPALVESVRGWRWSPSATPRSG